MTVESPELGELRYLRLNAPRESHVLLAAGAFHGGASWSPNSEWISYTTFEPREPGSTFLVNSLFKVNVHNKERVRLVDGRKIPKIGEYTAWTARNEIYFATQDAFYVIDPQGGTPRRKLGIDIELERAPLYLSADAHGSWIAFSVNSSGSGDVKSRSELGIWLAELEGSRIVQLTHGSSDSFPVWHSGGTIFFLRESAGGYSLHSVKVSTGEVSLISDRGTIATLGKVSDQALLFAATADRWDHSGNDFNFFRGFSIASCTMGL